MGVFALIGGLLVWSGFAFRQEAKKDVAEIKEFKKLSANVYAAQQESFTNYQKKVQKTLSYADDSVRLLSELVNQADKDSKAIREAKKTISSYKRSKASYSQAAIEMARKLLMNQQSNQ